MIEVENCNRTLCYFDANFPPKKKGYPTNVLGKAFMITRELIKLSEKIIGSEIVDKRFVTIKDLGDELNKMFLLYDKQHAHKFYDDFDSMLRAYRIYQNANFAQCKKHTRLKNLDWLKLDQYNVDVVETPRQHRLNPLLNRDANVKFVRDIAKDTHNERVRTRNILNQPHADPQIYGVTQQSENRSPRNVEVQSMLEKKNVRA